MSADLDKGRSPAAKTQGKAEDAAEQALLAAVHSGKTQAQHLDEPLAHPQMPASHFSPVPKSLLKMPKVLAKVVGGKIHDARGQMMYMQPKHMRLLTHDAIQNLSKSDIEYLTELRIKAFSDKQLDSFSETQLAMFDDKQISDAFVQYPSDNLRAALKNRTFEDVKPEVIKKMLYALTPDQIIGLLKNRANSDNAIILAGFNKQLIDKFSTAQLALLLNISPQILAATYMHIKREQLLAMPQLPKLLMKHDPDLAMKIAEKVGESKFLDLILAFKPLRELADPVRNGITEYLGSHMQAFLDLGSFPEALKKNEKITHILSSIFNADRTLSEDEINDKIRHVTPQEEILRDLNLSHVNLRKVRKEMKAPVGEISKLTTDDIQRLQNDQIRRLTKEQIGQFTFDQIGAFRTDQLNHFRISDATISDQAVATLVGLNIFDLSPEFLSFLSVQQIKKIDRDTLTALTGEQLQDLNADQLRALFSVLAPKDKSLNKPNDVQTIRHRVIEYLEQHG